MVARAGADFRLRGVGPVDEHLLLGVGRAGVLDRVNDHHGDAHLLADRAGEGGVALGVLGGALQAENLGHMEGLALVQAQGDVVVRLEFSDDLEGGEQVGLDPLGRVGQVKEHVFPLAGLHRLEFGEELFPDGRHVRQHRPVDHPDEIGGGPQFLHQLVAQPLDDRLVVCVLHGGVLAEHDLAVVELEGGGQGGFGKGVNLGPLGELLEHGMDFRVSAHAHVLHRGAQGGHGEGHEGAVAADLFHRGDDLEVGALAGRLADLLGEGLDRGVGQIFGRRLALFDHLEDGVEEPVESEETGEFEELGAGTDQSLRGLPG